MSGYFGIRATGDFIEINRRDLLDLFKPKNNKLHSFQTISRVLIGLDFDSLNKAFINCSKDYDWYSIDGKGISGTVKNSHDKLQEYVNLVSLFSDEKKQVLSLEKISSKKGEILAVRDLLKMLDLDGVIFTLDELHFLYQV